MYFHDCLTAPSELDSRFVEMDGGRERSDGTTARKYVKPAWKRTRRVMKGDCYKVRATA